MRSFLAIFSRDLRVATRQGGGLLDAFVFFAMAIFLFALALGPDIRDLAANAPAIIWAAAFFASIVSLDRIFQADFEDGALDVMVEAVDPLAIAIFAKAASHWATTSLPIALATPALGPMLGLDLAGSLPVAFSLLLGGPAFSLIGAIGAAATVALRRASILISLITAPLLAPTLIFGVSAAKAGVAGGTDFAPALLILFAITIFAAALGPIASAMAIRFNVR